MIESPPGEYRGRVLIIHPDDSFASAIGDHLWLHGHDVHIEDDANAGLRHLSHWMPDLVILDPALRDGAEVQIMRRLRRVSRRLGILAIGDDAAEADVVLALRTGADDYVVRPPRTLEFLARADALIRRSADRHPRRERVEIRGISIDRVAQQVTRRGRVIRLSPVEYRILDLLFERAGVAVSRTELLGLVSPKAISPRSRTIDLHVAHLRRKLERSPALAVLIETVHRFGYRVVA